jgi:hypothetical protein
MFYVNVLVICITVLQAPASPKSGAPPVLDPTANPEAYEIILGDVFHRYCRWCGCDLRAANVMHPKRSHRR